MEMVYIRSMKATSGGRVMKMVYIRSMKPKTGGVNHERGLHKVDEDRLMKKLH